MDSLDELLAGQQTYYDLRAPEHEAGAAEWFGPVLDPLLGLMRRAPLTGEVLELAPGTGFMTRPLSEMARSVTAVDGSSAMLAVLQRRGLTNVTTLQADLFAWQPPRRWDALFMSNFLAHVPPPRLEPFWQTLDAALAPGGSVIVVDSTPAETWNESQVFQEDAIPLVRRPVAGQQFAIVRVFWEPDELLKLLRTWGWSGTVTVVGAELGRGVAFYTIRRAQ